MATTYLVRASSKGVRVAIGDHVCNPSGSFAMFAAILDSFVGWSASSSATTFPVVGSTR